MHQGGRNRAAIIGVGGWGARVVAHLWPRLRMADRGRTLAPTIVARGAGRTPVSLAGSGGSLPRLGDMVSLALLLPGEDGNVTVARPRSDLWDDVGFARFHMPAYGGSQASGWELPGVHQSVRQLQQETYQALWPTLDIVGHYPRLPDPSEPPSRLTRSLHFLQNQRAIISDLAATIEQARVDENVPDEEVSQLTIFVVASLADPAATALLWLLAYNLRRHLEGRVLAEQVGLLSTGVYAAPPERLLEEAAVHVAVEELAHLMARAAGHTIGQASLLDDLITVGRGRLPAESLQALPELAAAASRMPPFDRTYLIDREKTSGALVKDEGELTTVVGNALEIFLTADANLYLRDVLAPDASDLLRTAPYSSLGAACVYVPLDDMWAQARQRFTVDLLREHFLVPLPDDVAKEARTLAAAFVKTRLGLRPMAAQVLDSGIVTAAPAVTDSEGAELPDVVVHVSLPELDTVATGSDVAEQATTLNEHFDRFERQDLAQWVSDANLRAGQLVEPPDGDGSRAPWQALHELDDEVCALLTTHDQGLQAALAYTGGVLESLQQQQESLLEARRRLRARTKAEPTGSSSPWPVRIQRVVAILPAWPITLGSISLLVLVVVALALQGGQADTRVVLFGSIGAAVGVLLLGLVARLAYLRWLQGSVDRVAARRQVRLNQLAQAALADASEILSRDLIAAVRRRQAVLEQGLESLQQERETLADRLSKPLAVSHSFVRRPLAQEELYEELRTQPIRIPSGSVAAHMFQADPASSRMVRRAWEQGVQLQAALPAANGAKEPAAPGLGEAFSLAIERYAARLSQPEAPADVSVEDLLPRAWANYDEHEFLLGLRQRAKPLIHLDEQIATVPIGVELMAVPAATTWTGSDLGAQAAALRVRLLSSYDPFSLILLRTLHGLSLEAITSLRHYAMSFAGLSPGEKRSLVISSAVMGEPTPSEQT